MWLLSVFFIKIFFKITEIFFRFILLKKVMNIELYIYLLSTRGCVRCHHAVFSTAWVREVLYKSLNLLAAIRNN